jgi:hypothetical protein
MMSSRLARIEKKLDLLLKEHGISEGWPAVVDKCHECGARLWDDGFIQSSCARKCHFKAQSSDV